MYTKTKLNLGIGILVSMIILLVLLSVVNLQFLAAIDPNNPAAVPALQRALLMVSVVGVACIFVGILLFLRLPASINRPVREIIITRSAWI